MSLATMKRVKRARRREPGTLAEQLHRWIEYPALGTPFPDTLFDRPSPRMEIERWVPAVELSEREREFLLTVELPGLRKEDVELSLDDGVLTIRGEKRMERDRKRGRVRFWERAYGSFERCFVLPRGVDANAIEARFHNGVLEVHMPKAAEPTNERHIEIR